MKRLLESIVKIDTKVIKFFDKNHNNKLASKFFAMYTQLGKAGIYAIIIFFIMFIFKTTRDTSYVVGASILLNAILVNLILKNVIKRTRPFHKFPNVKTFVRWPKDYSFPSGHTAVTSACTVALFYVGVLYNLPIYFYIINIIFLVLMGYSRLYLRVHFLSDVIGGLIIGSSVGIFVVFMSDYVIKLGNFLINKLLFTTQSIGVI